MDSSFNFACPLPYERHSKVMLAHGSGGKLMHQLVDRLFLPTFQATETPPHDAAVFESPGQKIAFTTDSFVVDPLFFPGGDIGSLAVNGTVNDLAMAGARPLYLSAGFILEEGLPLDRLARVVQSMQQAANKARVRIITGDTKVVERGKGDGMFINTTGVGVVECETEIGPQKVQPGDLILLNGDIARHGIAVMSVREGLEFEAAIASDSAPLAGEVLELLAAGVEIHCLRDLTRGGLASALNEIAIARGIAIEIDEDTIPVREEVRGACEILGLDPLYVANEGRFIAFVAPGSADLALSILNRHALQDPSVSTGNCPLPAKSIGTAIDSTFPRVVAKNAIGSGRLIDMLSGDLLPRIC
ncbi:hydrogenase expression/formation protein HypE [Synechococcus sp. PCC 7336]|uniref:hydrogenase expression/formation protein HypE n=1 Tax=Synechococcus sp. PCC 7336 TaxID=195250 RepID=UPI000362941D|nr:hydrogenase expression/formation protein HypE [Synechococcus sp. PCC 7336]